MHKFPVLCDLGENCKKVLDNLSNKFVKIYVSTVAVLLSLLAIMALLKYMLVQSKSLPDTKDSF